MSALAVYLLAIGANLAFSTSSIFFSYFAHKFSSAWINQAKVVIALACFVLAAGLSGVWIKIDIYSLLYLLISGLIGLCWGDLLLFRAFTHLGPARTLVMFSFGPLILGIYGFLFLGQHFSFNQTLAVICMISCILVFMLEKKGQSGSWELKSFLLAFTGILLDATGVMLTRQAFEYQEGLHSFQVNSIRCLGAIAGFIIIKPTGYRELYQSVKTLLPKDKLLLIACCVTGTFISLSLYLSAVKYAHMGTLTAISITGPVWVSLIDCIYHKRLPNPYLLTAFSFFLIGFYFMVKV